MSNPSNTGCLSQSSMPNVAPKFTVSVDRIKNQISQAVYDYVNADPVKSFIRADRCGPNPNPEFCYLQKTKACENIRR